MRKQDPGELFNWALLASRGIGLWPKPIIADWDEATFLAALARYGYDIEGPAGAMAETACHAAILAFERHFRPQHLTGRFDPASASILTGLLQAAGIDRDGLTA
jgi:N-acetylmuramoyl-L-alanine amidase